VLIQQEETLTASFVPEQASISKSFDMEEHFNLVVPCLEAMRDRLWQRFVGLSHYSELALAQSDNYHMTVMILPLPKVTDSVASELQAVAAEPLELDIKGIHIRPPGIFVNAYGAKLLELRKTVAGITDIEFDPDNRLSSLGWITIARFLSVPSQALVDAVKHDTDLVFGLFANNPHLHRSSNRM